MKTSFMTLALAAGALASPIGLEKRAAAKCISNAEAQKFMGRFVSVLQHTDSDFGDYVTTANRLLTDDFQEISDSINMLANKPLGGVTADKATYISGAQHAPPTTGIESLAITVSNCNNIIWEWNMNGVGKATYPVKGIGMFKMVRGGKLGLKIQAKELKLEFNNIAWGLDTGYGWVKQDGTLLGRAPNPAPATTTPSTDAPASDAPASDAPASDAPASDAPASDAPASDTPAADSPAADTPAADAPAADSQAADTPAADAPAADAPASDAPTAEPQS